MRQALAGVALGLVVGGLVGFAAGRTGREAPAPVSATGESVVADAPRETPPGTSIPRPRETRPVPEPPRPARSRVTPPPRDVPPTDEPPPEDGGDVPERTPEELLHEIAAALRADGPLDFEDDETASRLARSGMRLPDVTLLDLALARVGTAGGEVALQIAYRLAETVSPEVAFATLESAVGGERPERLKVAQSLADRAVESERDASALALALLGHADPYVRAAGVRLASAGDAGSGTLLDVARRDPDDEVRSRAIWALMESATFGEDEDARAAVTPVVLLAAREGRGNLRREALMWLAEIGPEAADTALAILREGGLDDELLGYVIAPILGAGRADELFAADGSERVVSAAGWWIESEEPEDVSVHLPLFRHVVAHGDEELRDGAIYRLVQAGAYEEVDRIAGDGSLPGTTRAVAVEWLMSSDREDADEAERIGCRRLRELLDPAACDATGRVRVLLSFVEGQAYVGDDALRAETVALLRNVARNDPNTWVRDAAVDALYYLEE